MMLWQEVLMESLGMSKNYQAEIMTSPQCKIDIRIFHIHLASIKQKWHSETEEILGMILKTSKVKISLCKIQNGSTHVKNAVAR